MVMYLFKGCSTLIRARVLDADNTPVTGGDVRFTLTAADGTKVYDNVAMDEVVGKIVTNEVTGIVSGYNYQLRITPVDSDVNYTSVITATSGSWSMQLTRDVAVREYTGESQ